MCRMQYAMAVSTVLYCGDAVYLAGKYVFSTVMCLVLPMCILNSCSSVLCVMMVLGMFMFVKVISSLISVILLLVCALCLCVWCSGVFLVF